MGAEINLQALDSDYDEFVRLVFSTGKSAIYKDEYHNLLSYTHVELSCLTAEYNKNTSFYLEKALELVNKQIEFVEQQMFAEQTGIDCPLKPNTKRLRWTGKLLDYVEWVYALHEILNLNGGRVKLKTLFDVFNRVFGIKVKDFSQYFRNIRTRKKGDRTTLLDMQKQLLTERMEEADNKPSQK